VPRRPPTNKGPRTPADPDDPAAARNRALRLLARREHTARELKHKLELRGFDEERASEAVDLLTKAGWQSDARYVESFVRNRIQQACGPLRIEAELEAAGVTRELIRETLASAEVDWKELAAAVWARKFGTPPRGASDWQKQYRYLAGRGFDPSQIRAALKGEPPEE
jgi:regulatory protein